MEIPKESPEREVPMENTTNEVMLDEALIEEVSIDGMCGVY